MNPNLRNGFVTLIGGTALLIASCDVKTVKDLTKAIFLDPEPAKSDSRYDRIRMTPEGLRRQVLEPLTKPEGSYSIRPSKER